MNFDFSKLLHFDSGSVEQNNIIDPLIKLCIFCTPALFLFLWFGCISFAVYLFGGIISLIAFSYIFCLFFRPEKLQTEKYLLEQNRLEFQYNSKNGYNPKNSKDIINIAPEGTKLLALNYDEEEAVE